jgi:hypothetical protein
MPVVPAKASAFEPPGPFGTNSPYSCAKTLPPSPPAWVAPVRLLQRLPARLRDPQSRDIEQLLPGYDAHGAHSSHSGAHQVARSATVKPCAIMSVSVQPALRNRDLRHVDQRGGGSSETIAALAAASAKAQPISSMRKSR